MLIKFFLALNNAAFTPRVIIPGIPTAGDNFNITCRLDGVVERLVVTPTIVNLEFASPQGGQHTGEQSQELSVYTRQRIFSPGITNEAGAYTCFSTVRISSFYNSASSAVRLQIQSLLQCINMH